MKTYEITSESKAGIMTVLVLEAKTKREALTKFRKLTKNGRKYPAGTWFYPDEMQSAMSLYDQEPRMGSVEILDQVKETILTGFKRK